MAPDRSCSLWTSFFWLVSHLRPPSAFDTPWVALCYSSVTHLAFRPLPPPGTTPVLYPGAMELKYLGCREPTSPLNRHPLVAECSAVTYPRLILKVANPPDVNPALEHEFACKTPRASAHLTNPRLCRSVSQLTHSPRNLYVREAPSGTS
ncbi:hypothetical protein M404DRAFT_25350 [Pisolithus tinctorius Marx 270]|uniref:Secreted protein n=1 Tax=Pisolithus tinctorius Marx 270 TaxID=870435 RepID=A0A0C3K7Q9_PISTI|nr:hypothetical protein M404DRAFT_25350 [Pisolithus tinctorius Marx 270]